MANVTAADVNKLRKQTGAGMMDCKKALVEAEVTQRYHSANQLIVKIVIFYWSYQCLSSKKIDKSQI